MTAHDVGPDELPGRVYDRRLVARLWTYARAHRTALLAAAALLPVLAAVELVQPYLVKIAIDDHITQGDWAGLSHVAALFTLTLLAQYALRFLGTYLMLATGQRVVHDLRQALFEHVQRLPASFFDRTPVGRLMTRVLGDGEAIGELFASGVVAVFGDALVLSGVVVVMLLLDWRLALVSFAAVPILGLVAGYFRARAREAYREVRNRIARLNAYLQETLQGVIVVQLFGREAAHAAEFGELNEAHRRAVFRRMRYDALLYAGVEVIGSVAVAGLLWWGGGQILAGTLTFGVLVAFMEYTHRFFLPIRDLSAKYTVMQSAMVAAERIFALLDSPVEVRPPGRGYRPSGDPWAGASPPPAPAIEFRDVWFAYGPRAGDGAGDGTGPRLRRHDGGTEETSWVLRGLSVRIARGERVALVGATGAGKTTLARLLTRLYDVDRGAVLVDGVDVREWDLDALRRHVGLVLQDVVVFAGTVAENLALGRRGVSGELLEAAARQAHADDFIRALPDGYAADIRERGANLSHGQRQLMAVARALVYNPPVLVLDEATSSVDPETEASLQDALDRLLQGRTSMVIAHRLSTIRRVDRILVLHGGRLVEDGPHDVLVGQGGVYAALHELGFGAELTPGGPSR
jgi:ATP-binding cassette subfamily B protein